MDSSLSLANEDTTARWIALAQAMRGSAEDPLPSNAQLYGQDIVLDQSSVDASSDDDIWDLISTEDEAEDSSSEVPDVTTIDEIIPGSHDVRWLAGVCARAASDKSGLNPNDLQEHVSASLASDLPSDQLQGILVDILGYDELDLVSEILDHRKELTTVAINSDSDHSLVRGLQTKAERLDALRRQDREHKSAPLAPAIQRDSTRYPHVYTTHETGNTLSSNGKQYGLPLGSKREEHDVRATISYF